MSLTSQTSFWAELDLSWDSLTQKFKLPAAENFPVPLPSGNLAVNAFVEVKTGDSTSDQPQLELRLEAEFEINPDAVSFRGLTLDRTCQLRFSVLADTPDDLARLLSIEVTEPAIIGTLAVSLPVKLPQLPEFELIKVHSGDAEGWTTLTVTAVAGVSGELELGIQVSGGFLVDLYFPALSSPEAPLHLSLDDMSGRLQLNVAHSEKGKFSGQLNGNGHFNFRPQLAKSEVPMIDYLKPLFDGFSFKGSIDAGLALTLDNDSHRLALSIPDDLSPEQHGDEIHMTVRASILLTEENPEVCISCRLNGPPLYPFGLLRQLVQTPRRLDKKDTKVGPEFALNGFYVCLSQNPSFGIEMSMQVGSEVPAFFKLSTTELSLGLGHLLPGSRGGALDIPLRLPRVSRKDFGFHEDRPVAGSRNSPDVHPIDRLIHQQVEAHDADSAVRYDDFMELYFEIVEKLSGIAPHDERILLAYKKDDNWLVQEPAQDSDSEFQFDQRLAMGLVGVEHEDEQHNRSFKTTGELAIVGRTDQHDWQVLIAKPVLRFDKFSFSMSFRNPRDIRVSGTVRFVTEGWFAELSKLALSVGLSADLIYFSLEVNEQTRIRIPEFIPGYKGGSISIGKFMFGFGYLKRSGALAFAGELELPKKLVDDLDTSEVLGAGIRLPIKSKLAFQFDLMPFVVKEVVILIPLFQFNWDLRQDVSPGLIDSHTCEPFWDGLQLIIPDVIRCSLKRISYSPIFLCYCSSNSDFDGDLMLGDSQNGLTIVADNVYWDYGIDCAAALVMAPITWPPFVDNLCINLRLAGFGLHFNFQRPVPSFSPLGVFEMLALIVDPLYEIEPRGELADTMRVTLEDAYIVLPQAARRLFPQAEALLRKPINVTINIATFLTFLQRIVKSVKPVADAVFEALRNGQQVAGELQQRVTSLTPDEIGSIARDCLGMLPPELLKLRLDARFAGFEATAVLLLTDAKGLNDALTNSSSGNTLKVRRKPGAPRLYDPASANNNLLDGSEFSAFSREDFNAVFSPANGSTGIVIGARVRVFSNQRFRFIGSVSANGAFNLVTAEKIEPLQLKVAGIPPALPFAIEGRLQLSGRAKRDRIVGSIRAHGRAQWNVADRTLLLSIGVKQPAELELFSDGKFKFSTDAILTFFNNQHCKLEGNVEVSETHCLVSGRFHFIASVLGNRPLFDFHARATGRIGPGSQFLISFDTELGNEMANKFYGLPLTNLRGTINESGIELEISLTQGHWMTWPGIKKFNPGIEINNASLKGWINLRETSQPDFELQGEMKMRLFSPAGPSIVGRGGFYSRQRQLGAFVEGKLNWQGRDWIGGRLDVGPDNVRVAGEASFQVTLTPPSSENIKLSQLVVRLDLSGEFGLNIDGKIARIEKMTVYAMLALSFPSADKQPLPLAVAEVSIQKPVVIESKPDAKAFELELLDIKTILPDINVKVNRPTLTCEDKPVPRGIEWESDPVPVELQLPQLSWDDTAKRWLFTGGARKQTVVAEVKKPKLVDGSISVPTRVELNGEPISLSVASLLSNPFKISLAVDETGKSFVPKIT